MTCARDATRIRAKDCAAAEMPIKKESPDGLTLHAKHSSMALASPTVPTAITILSAEVGPHCEMS